MKKTLYITFLAVAMAFVSCQKDPSADLVNDANKVTLSAESITPLTRVSGTEWEDADAIGITVLTTDKQSLVYDNIKYVASGDGTLVNFNPDSEAIYFSEDGTPYDFKAFYPYDESWSYEGNNMIYDISAQDGTEEAQNNVDLLVSDNLTGQTKGAQILKFTHALTKVQITVSNYDELSAYEDFSGLTAVVSSNYTEYDCISGTRIEGEQAKNLGMYKTTVDDNTVIFTAIILPSADGISEQVIFSSGDTRYTATLAMDETLSSKQYNFKVVIGDQGLTIVELTNDGIENWDDQGSTDANSTIEIVDGVYQISTASDLKLFAQMVNRGNNSINGKLLNDINLNGSENDQWTPIGNSSKNNYIGDFDGAGFMVSGIYINDEEEGSAYKGLFGYLAYADIINLGVSGTITTKGNRVGGIAGYATMCEIVNCYNLVEVTGGNYVGGILGYQFVGRYNWASVANCYNLAHVSGKDCVGGVVGYCGNYVTSCYSSAQVTGDTNVGGVVGYLADKSYSRITSCYYNSVYISEGVGGAEDGNTVKDTEGVTAGYMKTQDFVSKLNYSAYQYNIEIENWEYLTVETCAWKAVSGDYPVLDVDNEPTEDGIVYNSDDEVYEIYSAAGLTTFAEMVNSGSTSINGKLINDINLTGTWTPMIANGSSSNGYSGTFDGDGYSITGLSVTGSASGQGLFGTTISPAIIKNLKVGGSVSNSASHAAIIIGKAWYTTIENCETLEGSTVTGTGGDSHAGIAGYAYNCTFSDCINRTDVVGVSCVAGIVGYTNEASSNITTITNCANYGQIESQTYAGGIAGTTNGAAVLTITNCYNEGSVTTTTGNFAGGVVAKIYGTSSSRQSKVMNCANIGTVTCATKYSGGLAGANQGGLLYNSYNLGAVSGASECVGGLVGIHESYTYNSTTYKADMQNCYTSGAVSGTTESIGLAVGKCDGATISNCYYDSSQYEIISGIGTNNDNQSVAEYSSLSSLLTVLNKGVSNVTGAEDWVTGSDDYPTFSFINAY